jgi:subtilisin
MSTSPKLQRFILMPPRGLTANASASSTHLSGFMQALTVVRAGAAPQRARSGVKLSMKVLDSIHEDGLKLVEMSLASRQTLHETHPGLRVVPEVFYQTARAPRPVVTVRVRTKSGTLAAGVTLKIVSSVGAVAVKGADVIAFTDFAARAGASGKTRADGTVLLNLGATAKIERLYVYPHDGFWPLLKKNFSLPVSAPIKLKAIDLGAVDVLQFVRKNASGSDGANVKAGIIDTGSGPHPDLPIAGGFNAVLGESETDFLDNGDQHGTHVAGIVGARGTAPAGMRGLAPKVELFSYRVFAKGKGASNFAIAKAIDRAVADGCDLINMSLGGGPADPAVSGAIADARAAGVVVVCASGNDGLPEVSQPGADSRALAVGAFGRKGTFPAGSATMDAVGKLGTPDRKYFMANFSNTGVEIDFAGPGVGVVSTVPTDAYAVMDGTSMASPAITGMIARLLSANAAVRNMPRDQARSDEILKLAFLAAKTLGFGPNFEGSGWIK